MMQGGGSLWSWLDFSEIEKKNNNKMSLHFSKVSITVTSAPIIVYWQRVEASSSSRAKADIISHISTHLNVADSNAS